MTNPLPHANTLASVWASTTRDVWTVGERGTVLHWDGERWTVHETATEQDLVATWGSGPADVWAVGTSGTMLHWDGARWTLESQDAGDFRGLWGSAWNDVWALGEKVLHFDGANWTEDPVASAALLWRIDGSASDRIWGVGTNNTVWRFDGSIWSAVDLPVEYVAISTESVSAGVTNVAVGPDAVWMTHHFAESGPVRWRLIHWREGTFEHYEIPPIGFVLHLTLVDGIPHLGAFGGTWRFNGSTFDQLGGDAHAGNDLFGLARDAIWRVSQSVVWRWNGLDWERMTTGPLGVLRGIAEAGDHRFAFGIGGSSVLTWNGMSWESAQGFTPRNVRALWGTNATRAWAAAELGLYVWDGGTWTLHDDSWGSFTDVLESDAGVLWATGRTPLGTGVFRYDGSWSLVSDVKIEEPVKLAGSSQDDLWVLGAGGFAYHFDGEKWSLFSIVELDRNPFSARSMHAIHAPSPREAWAVGDEVIARWDGEDWRLVDPEVSASWFDVHAIAEDDVWAVGDQGLWHYDGHRFRAEPLSVGRELRGVGRFEDGALWVVGDGGTIIERR